MNRPVTEQIAIASDIMRCGDVVMDKLRRDQRASLARTLGHALTELSASRIWSPPPIEAEKRAALEKQLGELVAELVGTL